MLGAFPPLVRGCGLQQFVEQPQCYGWRPAVLTTVLTTMLLLMLLNGCNSPRELGEMTTEVSRDELGRLAERMQCEVPPGAEPIGMWTQTHPTESIRLKLRMTQLDTQKLIEQSPFAGKNLGSEDQAAFGPNVDWWDPGKVEMSQVGYLPLDQGDAELSLGVAPAGDGEQWVYLVWVDARTRDD